MSPPSLFVGGLVFCCFFSGFETRAHEVKAALGLLIPLPLPPKCWGYHTGPCSHRSSFYGHLTGLASVKHGGGVGVGSRLCIFRIGTLKSKFSSLKKKIASEQGIFAAKLDATVPPKGRQTLN